MEHNYHYSGNDAGAKWPSVSETAASSSPPQRLDQFTVPDHAHAYRRPDGRPYTLETAIEAIYRRRAHYVLVEGGTKRPIWQEYQKPYNRPSLAQVWTHLLKGGRVGLIPGSIGLACLDVDKGTPDQMRAFWRDHPPLCVTRSISGHGQHLWYEAAKLYGQRQGIEIPRYGLTADVKCWNAGWILLCDPIRLAQALDVARGRRRSSGRAFRFPEIAVYGVESQAVKMTFRGERLPRERRTRAVRKGQLPLHFAAGAPEHFRAIARGGRNEALRASLVEFFKFRGRERDVEDAEARWWRRIYDAALTWNESFPEPMTEARVRSTSRSVAGFLWPMQPAKAYMADTSPDRQRERQRKQAESRRRKNRGRDQRIREMRENGVPVAQIAEEAGLSRVRVYQLLRDAPMRLQGGHTASGEPPAANERRHTALPVSVDSGVLNLPIRPPSAGEGEIGGMVTNSDGGDPCVGRDEKRRSIDETGGGGDETRMPDYEAVRAREIAGIRVWERAGRRQPERRMDQRVQCPANEGLDHAWVEGVTEIGAETVAVETCGLCGRARFVFQ